VFSVVEETDRRVALVVLFDDDDVDGVPGELGLVFAEEHSERSLDVRECGGTVQSGVLVVHWNPIGDLIPWSVQRTVVSHGR